MEINENSGMATPSGFVPAGSLPQRDAQSAAPSARSRKSSQNDFTGTTAPVQLRLPSDLITSLRLLSYDTGKSMSELVLEALTTETTIPKAWVSTRKTG